MIRNKRKEIMLSCIIFFSIHRIKAGHQLDRRSISAISDAYFDTSWRGDISWYLDYD